MTRSFYGRRVLRTAGLVALVAVASVVAGARIARAILLAPNNLYFDAATVPANHTLHVHVVNQLGVAPGWMTFRASLRPTTPAAGAAVLGAPVALLAGEGFDQAFPFAAFSPPAGVTRVPVVCTIQVSPGPGTVMPVDWMGRVATSVEVIDDATGQPTAILGGRHVVVAGAGGALTPCVFCN
jgi:hypothetical protein